MQYQFYYDQYRQWQLYQDYLMDNKYHINQFHYYLQDHCQYIKSANYTTINTKRFLIMEFDTEIDYGFFILSQ